MAKNNKAKIGIGDGGGFAVESSVKTAEREGFADVTVYNDALSLVEALKKGEINAAVRGSLEAKTVLTNVKSRLEVKNILRIAFLVMGDEKLILLAPVGVDEGVSLEEKLKIISLGSELLSKFNVETKAGVLSGGRFEDMGRDETVDKTLQQGEKLTKMANKKGISSKHFGIQLEEALESSNIIVAPDGITGNLMFRALHFMGGGKAIGAPIVNINKVFIDTSRSKKDYSNSIALAGALSGL